MRFKMINPKVSDIAHLQKMQGSEIITVPGFSQEWWSSPLCSHALPSEYFPPPNKIIAENFHFYILKIIQQLHLKVHWILDWSWYWMRCHLVGEGKSHGKERPMSIARFSQPRVVISFQICFNTRTTNSELQKSAGLTVLFSFWRCNYLDLAGFSVTNLSKIGWCPENDCKQFVDKSVNFCWVACKSDPIHLDNI